MTKKKMDEQKRKEKEWAIATGKMDLEPISEDFCKIETCGRFTNLLTLRLCHKHYARFRTGRMDELTGELRSLYPKTIECKGCGDKLTIEPEKQKAIKYCDYCRDHKRKEYESNRGGIVEYRFRKRKPCKIKTREFHEILIPVYDDFGDIVRYKKDQIETTIDTFRLGYEPVFWGGPGVHDKYGLLNSFIKCRCGKYTSYIGKCSDCGNYQAFLNLPIDITGDRSRNIAIEELFLMGLITCDVAMNLHESETNYRHDGRDPEQSEWWGG